MHSVRSRRSSSARAASTSNERYPDAATMRAALADVGDALPPPPPLVLAGMFDGADPHPTRTQAPTATARLFDQDAAVAMAEIEPCAEGEPAAGAVRRRCGLARDGRRSRRWRWRRCAVRASRCPGLVGLTRCGGAKRPPTPRGSTPKWSRPSTHPTPKAPSSRSRLPAASSRAATLSTSPSLPVPRPSPSRVSSANRWPMPKPRCGLRASRSRRARGVPRRRRGRDRVRGGTRRRH